MRYPNEASYCFIDGGELVVLPDPRIGTVLAGRYVIEAVLGEGGMATVYRARHKLATRAVAIKVLNPLLASDAVVRERFRREARNAEKLAHPNIIEILEQGETDDGTAFIVMELLDGEPLSALIRRGPIEVGVAVQIMIQCARGIARAHDLDVIHRDIKPENIFVCPRPDGPPLVKILDFGIAKSRHDSRLTGQGELFGTPQYMAPERILGVDTSGSADLYALGVVFFEMLTGQLPFDAPDVATFFVQHMNSPPPSIRGLNPRVPQALDDTVLRMLAKTAEERPVDAHRVHQDLLELSTERHLETPPKAEDEPLSVQAPITLRAGTVDPWARRIVVFEQMLSRAFGERRRAPEELTALLEEVNGLVRKVEDVRLASVHEQEALERDEQKGREKRAQLGFAVDALGVDASRAKEELRAARETQRRAEQEALEARRKFQTAHHEILVWEGRTGFAEPWPDLSASYRRAADAVDEWNALRQEERRSQEAAEAADRAENDLDFQIRELRKALAANESELDALRAEHTQRIHAHDSEAEALENHLVERMKRFCGPLRARPELEPLFKELETEAAA